jgi:ubiquinone/menaquinone biosynthesis C-methylase UbiE
MSGVQIRAEGIIVTDVIERIEQTDVTATRAGAARPQPDLTPPHPLRQYAGSIPARWGQDLIALLPEGKGGWCLDHGCGDGADRALLEAFGYRWVGIDIRGDRPSVRGSVHHLPFGDDTFSMAVSIAVFEHLADPFAAARELHRVLEPGGLLLGTVAFLEPFHDESYFHMTHLGIAEVLGRAGFVVLRLWPTWPVLESLLEYWVPSRVPVVYSLCARAARLLARGTLAARTLGVRVTWRAKGRDAQTISRRIAVERLTWTGSVGFLARKEALSPPRAGG